MRRAWQLISKIMLICAFALTVTAAEPSAPRNEIRSIRYWTAPDHTRIVLDMSSESRYEVKVLTDPHRIAIDVISGRFASGVEPLQVKDGVLDRIRINRLRTRAQVVLDLPRATEFAHFALEPNRSVGRPHRIVIDLERELTREEIDREAAQSQRIAESGDNVVILDPGHGGSMPGSCSRGGHQEKTFALKLAKMIAVRLNATPGFRAVLTREGDYNVGLGRRIAIARDHGGDCFVSLHFNSHENTRARGSEVYFLSLGGASDENAEAVAERENLFLEMGEESERFDSDLKSILFDLNRTNSMYLSSVFADEIARQMRKNRNLPFRGIKQNNYVVLRSIAMPSVLIEGAFLSNRKDIGLIQKESVLQELAQNITDGIVAFFEEHNPSGQEFARKEPVVHVVSSGETLWAIAKRYNVTIERLRMLNDLGRRSKIVPGQKLRIYE
jgi:N-acetylmuramoyl-L-alanine amidase